MVGTMQFTIGAKASCSDGTCAEVTRVTVDPVAAAVTHLVVEPERWRGPGRLVPLSLTDATAGQVRLRCTRAEFEKPQAAEETQFLPGTSGYPGYGPGQAGYWPYYGLGTGGGIRGGSISQTVTYDSVPQGEVDVRRGEHVQATDGNSGRAAASPSAGHRHGPVPSSLQAPRKQP
jgi:hypothetical protein